MNLNNLMSCQEKVAAGLKIVVQGHILLNILSGRYFFCWDCLSKKKFREASDVFGPVKASKTVI